MIGIIGGSGLYEMKGVAVRETKKVSTPFGDPSDAYIIGDLDAKRVVFLPRHGSRHTIQPHRINYRANIWGFKELGIERLISIGATGGIHSGMMPGAIVVPDQIIDMTYGRAATFYDNEKGVVHIDLTEPYCPEVRNCLIEAGNKAGIGLKKSGTYICTNGPRLETRAEIQFYSQIGADVVGMTAMPEASLAREAELCYAGVSVVTNYAAGITGKKLTATEVVDTMHKTTVLLKKLLAETLKLVQAERSCSCKEAMKNARV
jgi:5'-deoxy-5'-methylthioadenosine phosphorylase